MSDVNYNINKTTSPGLSASMQTYYDKQVIRFMKPRLVHQSYGQKRGIPKNGGKTIQFRKYSPFEAVTTPLTEGVTPDGQTLAATEQLATVDGYGGYLMGSDMLELTSIDPPLDEAAELLGDQAGLSIDHVVRDVINTGTNVQYANSKTSRDQLLVTDKLTTTEIRKAVRTLKNNKAKPFIRNGKPYYYAIVDANAAYDLMDDERWQKVADYQQAEKVENGEIGKLFGCVFIETTEAKQFAAANLSAANRNLTVASISGKEITVTEALTSDDANKLIGRTVGVVDVGPGVWETAIVTDAIEGAAGAATVTIDYLPGGFIIAADDLLFPGEAGANGDTVNSTLVFGKDSYGVIDVEDSGAVRNLIKPKGSAGTTDPLDQRWTSGWKVEAFASAILQALWIVRIEHGFTR